MIKSVVTLIRGSAAASADEPTDRHALLFLDQQMRDSHASLVRVADAVGQSRHGRIEPVRLRERQQDPAYAEDFLDRQGSVEQRLAEPGFGQGQPTAASVLARLKQA